MGGDKVADGTAEFTIRKISNTAKLDENNTYEPTNTVNYVNTTKTSINSGGLEFYGGKDEYNALFQLIGRDAKEFSGAFRLLARNKEKSAELRGMLDGRLTWLEKPLIYIESMTANCIRYSNGYQECWSNFTSNDGDTTTVYFDEPFKDYNICISLTQVGINGYDQYSNGFRSNGIEPSYMIIQNKTNGTNRCDWTARGWWK